MAVLWFLININQLVNCNDTSKISREITVTWCIRTACSSAESSEYQTAVFDSWLRRKALTHWPCGSFRMPVVHVECDHLECLNSGWSSNSVSGLICISTTRFQRLFSYCLELSICRSIWQPKTSWRPPFLFCLKMRYVTWCCDVTEFLIYLMHSDYNFAEFIRVQWSGRVPCL